MFRHRIVLSCAVVLALCAWSAGAIWLSSIEGACVDERGRPLAGATLRFEDHSTGRRFQVTTDAGGKFYYIAVESGRYALHIHRRDGGADSDFPAVQIEWSAQTLSMNIDLRRNTVEVTRRTLLPESYRTEGTPSAVAAADYDPLSAEINRKLAVAQADADRGDWLAAIDPLTSAVRLDPHRDLPQALLANAYCHAAKQSPKDATELLQRCVAAYQAAIVISDQAAYQNNLGTAYAALGRGADAILHFRAAEQRSPGNRGLYQQNIGVLLVQGAERRPQDEAVGMLAQAAEAFQAALEAEPDNAEAHYWQGVVLLRLAASAPGKAKYRDVAAAFQKYLALAPRGPHAAEVTGLLPSVQEFAAQESK